MNIFVWKYYNCVVLKIYKKTVEIIVVNLLRK